MSAEATSAVWVCRLGLSDPGAQDGPLRLPDGVRAGAAEGLLGRECIIGLIQEAGATGFHYWVVSGHGVRRVDSGSNLVGRGRQEKSRYRHLIAGSAHMH